MNPQLLVQVFQTADDEGVLAADLASARVYEVVGVGDSEDFTDGTHGSENPILLIRQLDRQYRGPEPQEVNQGPTTSAQFSSLLVDGREFQENVVPMLVADGVPHAVAVAMWMTPIRVDFHTKDRVWSLAPDMYRLPGYMKLLSDREINVGQVRAREEEKKEEEPPKKPTKTRGKKGVAG